MTSTLKRLTIAILLVLAAVLAWNYISVWRPVSSALTEDPRNKVTKVAVYHQYLTNPSVLVFDLRSISGDASQTDVMRALFQSAKALKDKTYNEVILAYKGSEKFKLKGIYFQKMGDEYDWQNPIYMTRTFSENVQRLDGKPAFSKWTGGMLGVVKNQMDDLNSLHKEWYLKDWAASQ
ncbi:MAG TPA: hypothetical protein GXX62_01395 [Alcaligenaceae bacterium]|nr:hypothetical protein [Alcaligenaceae bacterium]